MLGKILFEAGRFFRPQTMEEVPPAAVPPWGGSIAPDGKGGYVLSGRSAFGAMAPRWSFAIPEPLCMFTVGAHGAYRLPNPRPREPGILERLQELLGNGVAAVYEYRGPLTGLDPWPVNIASKGLVGQPQVATYGRIRWEDTSEGADVNVRVHGEDGILLVVGETPEGREILQVISFGQPGRAAIDSCVQAVSGWTGVSMHRAVPPVLAPPPVLVKAQAPAPVPVFQPVPPPDPVQPPVMAAAPVVVVVTEEPPISMEELAALAAQFNGSHVTA